MIKFLLKQHEKSRALFEPGGKLEKLHPLFDAQDTFLLTPGETTKGSPHVRDSLDTKRMMITVVFALIPCILMGMWNAGHQYHYVNQVANAGILQDFIRGLMMTMPIIIVSYAVGGLWEVLFAVVRKHEINEGFLVTGILFPLTLPPTIPLWQVALGISFGVVIGKEIFGGTGFNVLNPALSARAFLYFAYPIQMSGDQVWTMVADKAHAIEGFSGATALGVAAQTGVGGDPVASLVEAGFHWKTLMLGTMGGSIGEGCFIACAIGAAILIITGVGSWRIMASAVIGLLAGSLLMNTLPGDNFSAYTQLPFHYHLLAGGFAFGIVFMATDPVSAAATERGKWIYGFLIGLLTVVIRVANPAYPEGIMMAILFMNVMAPLVDHMVLQSHIGNRNRYLRSFANAKG